MYYTKYCYYNQFNKNKVKRKRYQARKKSTKSFLDWIGIEFKSPSFNIG